MEIIGETRDDAAGEAFDKAAKLLSLPYPGGPLIDKLAKEGNPKTFEFPIANIPDYDFSFSGLKTSLLYFLRKNIESNENFIEENINDICASYQSTIIRTLFKKLIKAARQYQVKDVAIAGGVESMSMIPIGSRDFRRSLSACDKTRSLSEINLRSLLAKSSGFFFLNINPPFPLSVTSLKTVISEHT